MLRLAVELEGKKRLDLFPDNSDYRALSMVARMRDQDAFFSETISSTGTQYVFLGAADREYVSIPIDGLTDPDGWHGAYKYSFTDFNYPISLIRASSSGSIEGITLSGYKTQSTSQYTNGVSIDTKLKDAAIFMIVGN